MYIGAVATVICATVLTTFSSSKVAVNVQNLFAQVEALADGESGAYLICRCSRWSTQNCAVNNGGAMCASGIVGIII